MNGDVWKTLDWKNSELQGNYNSETDNIKIRHGKKDGIAYVFCSSNSLYKKDDRQDFVSKVVNKDKFEWENITQDIDHEKIIYIRDIWLSWYVVGINAKYNTIDALIRKMREETEGMQVITVGVSSEPALCEQDIEQAKYAKMCSNVKILRVRSKTHGCAISPVA